MSGTPKSAKYAQALSLAAAVIAVAGLLGVAIGVPWLTRLTSYSAPLQISTSISLLSLALAAYFQTRGRRLALAVFTCLSTVLSVGTVLEWVTDHSFGFDFTYALSPEAPVAGRMALPTCLCLTGLALAQFACLPQTWRAWVNSLRGMVGALVSITGLTLLILSLCRIETFATGSFSNQTSVPAGAAIFFLGLAITIQAYSSGKAKKVRCRWLAAPVGIGIALGAFILWNAAVRSEATQRLHMARQTADEIKSELSSRLRMESLAMRRMAERMATGQEMNHRFWEVDATNYQHDFSEFQAVEWINPDLRIAWMVPLKGNEKAIGLDLRFEARRRTAISDALNTREITVSRPIKLVQGGIGFLIYAPIFADGKFNGIVAAVCHTDQFVGSLRPDLFKAAELEIRDGGAIIYANAGPSIVHGPDYPQASVPLDDLKLELTVRPTLETYNRSHSPLPAAILGCGLAVALLAACAVLFWERATHFSDQEKEGRRFLESLSEASVTLTYVFSLRTKSVVYCNRFGLEFFDLNADLLYDAKAQWLDYLLHPDDQSAAQARFAEFAHLADGEVLQFEQRLRNSEGQFRWMLHRECVMTRDSAGHPHLVLGVAQDLTERREAEDEIRIRKEILDKTIDVAPVGFALVSAGGYWLQANKALCDLLGYTEEELKAMRFMDVTAQEDRAEDAIAAKRLIDGEIDRYSREKRYIHRSGAHVWIQLNVAVIRDADNTPLLFVTQVQDINERKIYEEQMAEYGRVLEMQKRELTRANAALQQENRVDGLTGISNRRWFDDRLEAAVHAAERFERPVSLIMLDVDHFKGFNDEFGHDAGDQVLRAVGSVLQLASSDVDLPARFGGEEFAIIVPDRTPDEVLLMAESVREQLAAVEGFPRPVTASFGVAVYGSKATTPFDLIKGADKMLYKAKRSGRNRVCMDFSKLDPVRHRKP